MSKVESLEKLLSSSHVPSQASASPSYAKTASMKPANLTPFPPARASTSKTTELFDSRACNLILFGLPESGSILVLKSDIDEFLEFLTGKSVNINDVFRLGKFSSSFKHPRPILIKLATTWDRKIILLHKRKLRDYKTPRLFLREDVPPNHRFRQKAKHPSPNDKLLISEKLPLVPACSDSSHSAQTSKSDRQFRRVSPVASGRSPSSPDDLLVACSTSPALSHSSSTSTSTVLQNLNDSHNGST